MPTVDGLTNRLKFVLTLYALHAFYIVKAYKIRLDFFERCLFIQLWEAFQGFGMGGFF